MDDAKMARERMAVTAVTKELRALSQRMAESFVQVDERFARIDERFVRIDERFAQIDARFEQQRQEFHTDLEEFAKEIKHAFNVSLEGMEAKLDAALDDTREQKRRLDALERTNSEEHRLMQVQNEELEADLQSLRRSRRRKS